MRLAKSNDPDNGSFFQFGILDDNGVSHGVITVAAFTSTDGSFQYVSVNVNIDGVETEITKEIENR